jgi:hypothetical protein
MTNAKFQAQSALLPTTIHFRPNQHPTPGAPPTSTDGTPSIGYVLLMWTNDAGIELFKAPAGKPTEQEFALQCKPQLPRPYSVQHRRQ